VPPLAFEQASSEQSASARKEYSGRLCIDLTCGLGVDAFFLAQRFERVIAIERDPCLAAIARENFRRLGVSNIEVVCETAEDFISAFEGPVDLIYADPDRRNAEGRKMVRMEDCSPDIGALLPLLRRAAPRLVVKLSPLFDVAEVFRLFGPEARVEVVSLGGECKEIVADVGGDGACGVVRAVAIGLGEYHAVPNECVGSAPPPFAPESYHWLVVPDVALQKGRLARRYFSERGIYIDSDNGYGFSGGNGHGDISGTPPHPLDGLLGRVYEIESIEPFDPKALKRRLKAQGVKGIDILRREFPLSAADIAHQLGIREGGKSIVNAPKAAKNATGTPRPKIAFTRAADRLLQITLKA
jgi:SAM-dependent methyltransferase